LKFIPNTGVVGVDSFIETYIKRVETRHFIFLENPKYHKTPKNYFPELNGFLIIKTSILSI